MNSPLQYRIRPGKPEAPLLVLLHGRGSDENDLLSLGSMISPYATVVTPRAPFPAAQWGYGPGWAWYRFIGGTTPEPESFESGQETLAEFLRWLPTGVDRPDSPLVIGGFSQGGTSSLGWSLRHPGRAAGVLVFSGFVADHPSVRIEPETVASPVWWGHGTADQSIPFRFAETGWQALTQAGANLSTYTAEGVGHTITHAELADAAEFVIRL
ncbi:MAG TPA: alpha/beta hydrolase-fold protein [Gemmatimonadales bacterium]|nr:alpha/beta hydrolase-fold protein [Gemmatimonadales bacterium]